MSFLSVTCASNLTFQRRPHPSISSSNCKGSRNVLSYLTVYYRCLIKYLAALITSHHPEPTSNEGGSGDAEGPDQTWPLPRQYKPDIFQALLKESTVATCGGQRRHKTLPGYTTSLTNRRRRYNEVSLTAVWLGNFMFFFFRELTCCTAAQCLLAVHCTTTHTKEKTIMRILS